MGLRHATEPDHITTVATLGTHYKNHLRVGILWSIGHSATIMLAAFILYLGHINISNLFPISYDIFVGIAMMVMAIYTFHPHNHSHYHGEHKHSHYHSNIYHHKPLGFGLLHGLSGSGAAMLLFSGNLLFLGIFNIGVIVSMFIMTLLLGKIAPRLNIEKTRLVLSGIAFGVGLMLVLYHIPGLL